MSAPTPQRWQSRAEILKGYLDGLSPDELRRVRPDYYWQRFGYEAWRREQEDDAYSRALATHDYELAAFRRAMALERRGELDNKAGFKPDQPRVPAGSSEGGRWTSGSDGAAVGRSLPDSFSSARRRGRSIAYCLSQLTIDNLLCGSLEPASVRAACRSQAMERYAACISGRPIPPLPF